jgi:hypothetical protein
MRARRGEGRGRAYELKVPETVSLAVRTAASMSKGGGEAEEEASVRVAAYEFQSARRDGCDSLAVAVEATGPPVNQACAVLCIAAAGGDSTATRRGWGGRGWREVENDGSRGVRCLGYSSSL